MTLDIDQALIELEEALDGASPAERRALHVEIRSIVLHAAAAADAWIEGRLDDAAMSRELARIAGGVNALAARVAGGRRDASAALLGRLRADLACAGSALSPAATRPPGRPKLAALS